MKNPTKLLIPAARMFAAAALLSSLALNAQDSPTPPPRYDSSACVSDSAQGEGGIPCSAMRIGSGKTQHLPGDTQQCPPGEAVIGMAVTDQGTQIVCTAMPTPTPPPSGDCAASAVAWSENESACSASAPATTEGGLAMVTDSTPPTTGAANFRCTAGTFVLEDGTCTTPPELPPCSSTDLTWSQNGRACNALAPDTAAGSTITLIDSVSPNTGSASFTCNGGSWSSPSNAVCASGTPNCAATSMTWSVDGNSCTESLFTTSSGTSRTITDTTPPATGSATFTCSYGAWGAPTSATCEVTEFCPATNVSWTVSGRTCTGPTIARADGATVGVADSTPPNTGSAMFQCASGSWSYVTGTCTVEAAGCFGGTLGWAVGSYNCAGPASSASHGGTTTVIDSTAPETGTATFQCNNGVWSAPLSASCGVSTPPPCASTSLSWSVSGNTCNATAASTPSGASVTLSDTTAPTTGSAVFACNNGTWGSATNATCATSTAGCASANLTWTVGGNTCNQTAPSTASGATRTLEDTTTPTTGTATFACTNGTWGAPSAATCASGNACAATNLTWTKDGNSCTAAVPLTSSGQSRTISDTTAPTTGSATFLCSNGTWGAASNTSCGVANPPPTPTPPPPTASCTVYAVLADGSPSTSETWRFSGDTGTTHGTNNPPIDPQLFITTNSAFYSAPQVSGSVSGTYARATATIQGGGMQEFVREWRKHHTGSTDYDNWYTQVTEVYCNNGSISVVQQPQVWGGNACNSSLKLGQQGSNDRFWGCAKLGRSFTPGSCFNVTTNLSWRTSQSEYACRGDFAGPTVVGGGRHIRNGSTGYWMGSYTAEGCRTVSGSLTNSCTNGALFESSKSCSSTPNGNLCW